MLPECCRSGHTGLPRVPLPTEGATENAPAHGGGHRECSCPNTQDCPECPCPWSGETLGVLPPRTQDCQTGPAYGAGEHGECSCLKYWTTPVPLPLEATTESDPTQDIGLLRVSQSLEGLFPLRKHKIAQSEHGGGVAQGVLLLRTPKVAQIGLDSGGGSTGSAPTQHTGLPQLPA